MTYSVRVGGRDDLVATLRQFQADRGERSEMRRSREALEAANALEAGAESAEFEQVIYAVGDPDRYAVTALGREAVAEALEARGRKCVHDGKLQLAAETARALNMLSQGADYVHVGHVMYVVQD